MRIIRVRLLDGGELYRFAASRFLRIVPIYFVAVALIAWLVGADLNWFLANVFFVKGWGHLWSVAEEARFYVLFPLVILSLALLPGWLSRVVFLVGITWFAAERMGDAGCLVFSVPLPVVRIVHVSGNPGRTATPIQVL